MNQQTYTLPFSCTILFSEGIHVISQALSNFNVRHSPASPLTFTLSDLKNDMTLKYCSYCRPRHGVRVVHVITRVQYGTVMPFRKQNTSRANRCVPHEQLANEGMNVRCTIWYQFPKNLQ